MIPEKKRTDCAKAAMGPLLCGFRESGGSYGFHNILKQHLAGRCGNGRQNMKYLVTSSEMRHYDENTIEKIGIPACVLMERAALAAAELTEAHCAGGESRYVLILCGTGNNGGDGLAVARLLAEKHFRVEVWCVGNQDKASPQWRQQRDILGKYPVEFTDTPGRREYAALIDALFGVGLSRDVENEYAEAVALFNRLEGWKLALDLPSGIHSDTGQVLGCAVRADATVTFGFCKRGLVFYPGCEYAGKVSTADIGISERSFYGRKPEMYAYDEEPLSLLPGRDRGGNKGTFGKILLVAGSLNMAGAAILAAKAAYRTGAGMVKVITCEENRIILQQAVPEALLGTPEDLEKSMEWADVIAIGPGLGKSDEALHCLERVIYGSKLPLLADADALNLLAEHPELKEVLAGQGAEGRKLILTPHVGELARLAGQPVSVCKERLLHYGAALASALHAAVTAKDARTLICREKPGVCVNLSGCSAMATAGSGDVLAGITAALLAQGMEAFEAAAVGAYIHGRAGEKAAEKRGEYGCMAGDLTAQMRY